jgi:hypothetical protein
MDASDATDTQGGLPPPVSAARPGDDAVVPPEPAAVSERRPRRRTLIIVLAVWALVMAGEIGYVIGRDRATNTTAAARIEGSPGEFIVMQAVSQSLQDRLAAAQKALAESQQALSNAQANPSTSSTVQIPLQSFDPLGGAPLLVYSGTLVLASCTGFGDPTACAPQNQLDFTLARAADGHLTLSSAVFEGAPVTRAGGVLHAQGPVANPSHALACPAETMATFFDAELTPNQLTMTNGVPAISSFSATLTTTAPADSACTQPLQSVYQGTIAHA